MRKRVSNHLPERAMACLTCACEDGRNAPGCALLERTDALTSTGVLAAILIADSEEHQKIVALARQAILDERELCRSHGPFEWKRCGEHGLAALQRNIHAPDMELEGAADAE
jgi:hypothetical protein